MRALLVVALSALSVVSGNTLGALSAPPGTPCPYSSVSFDMTQGTLNRFKIDYSANQNAAQLYSCDVALRCPRNSNLMTLSVSSSKGGNPSNLAMLYTSVNNSRTSDTSGSLVTGSTGMAIPLTEGEGVGVSIWGNTGYGIIQATCHEITGDSPSSNREINYLAATTAADTSGTAKTAVIPQNSGVSSFTRRYAANTKHAYILSCSRTGDVGDLMYGTPVIQLKSITGNVGADDTMTILAADSNIARVYTKDNTTESRTFATAASTDRSTFEVSSAYAIRWVSGAIPMGEAGFTISYTCRNATGFSTSGAGAGMGSTVGSGVAAAFSATAAAVVAMVACLLA